MGAPLILIITGVQLCTPHGIIATATAVTTSCRAVGATVFTAVFGAAVSSQIGIKIPQYVAAAVLGAGLPISSVDEFMLAFVAKDAQAMGKLEGVTPQVVEAAARALKHAFADSIRVVYFITIPFGVLACGACLFLGDVKETMNYHVDAPVEKLSAKTECGERVDGLRRV